MLRIFLATLGFCLFGLLILFCLSTFSTPIQYDVVSRVEESLTENSTKDVSTKDVAVEADGRDVTLKGSAKTTTARARLGEIASNVWGVRSVKNDVSVDSKTKPESSTDINADKDSGDSILAKAKIAVDAFKSKLEEKTLNPKKTPAIKMSAKKSSITKSATLNAKDKMSVKSVFEQKKPSPDLHTRKVELSELDTANVKSCFEQYAEVISSGKVKIDDANLSIHDSSFPTLDKLAKIANECVNSKITILGHTDLAGEKKQNQILSTKQAQVVVSYLLNKGLSADRLAAIGFGESRPIKANITEAGRLANRRIEITVEELL